MLRGLAGCRPIQNACERKAKEENGAQTWIRTRDTAIFSRMLYQLSYLGAGEA